MRVISTVTALGLVGAIAACAPAPTPAPPPHHAPPPRPAPPPPAPAPQATDWRDIALTPGDWRYVPSGEGSEAVFAMAGGGDAFLLRCNRAARRIQLVRPAGGGSQLRIRTSFGARAFPGVALGGGVAAELPASEPFLDSMAFSRGRFSVESDSGAMLVLPAWPEPARVIEDCR